MSSNSNHKTRIFLMKAMIPCQAVPPLMSLTRKNQPKSSLACLRTKTARQLMRLREPRKDQLMRPYQPPQTITKLGNLRSLPITIEQTSKIMCPQSPKHLQIFSNTNSSYRIKEPLKVRIISINCA